MVVGIGGIGGLGDWGIGWLTVWGIRGYLSHLIAMYPPIPQFPNPPTPQGCGIEVLGNYIAVRLPSMNNLPNHHDDIIYKLYII